MPASLMALAGGPTQHDLAGPIKMFATITLKCKIMSNVKLHAKRLKYGKKYLKNRQATFTTSSQMLSNSSCH